MGVTPGEVLISGHTIRLDEITMSASVHWSAILYSILTDNLEVPIKNAKLSDIEDAKSQKNPF